jgi:hypothetical protein
MRPALLKAAATVLTLGATVASAVFVTSHLKNPAAPLQPPVLAGTSALGGVVVVGPSVQPTNQPPITSTYAS